MHDYLPRDDAKHMLPFILAIALLLFAFGVIAQNVETGASFAFDHAVVLAFRDAAHPSVPIGPSWLQEAARDLTSLGSIIVLLIVTFAVSGYLFLVRKNAAAWVVLSAALSGIGLNELLKLMFDRPRPDMIYQATRVFTPSFPSGHAELSAITYLTIAALLAQSQASFKIGLYFIAVAVLLTILIGVSRIYLGVHFPTDVLGGWCIGAAWALGFWALMRWLYGGYQVKPTGSA
jgi:undecaprenyl-diphosphatase